MSEEVKKLFKQVREILDKYPNRQKEILFYIFGEDTIRKIVNKPTYEELQQKINQLETNRDELKKWLRVCLEENNKIRLYDNNSYQAGEINTLENVIDKMQELERDKE